MSQNAGVCSPCGEAWLDHSVMDKQEVLMASQIPDDRYFDVLRHFLSSNEGRDVLRVEYRTSRYRLWLLFLFILPILIGGLLFGTYLMLAIQWNPLVGLLCVILIVASASVVSKSISARDQKIVMMRFLFCPVRNEIERFYHEELQDESTET